MLKALKKMITITACFLMVMGTSSMIHAEEAQTFAARYIQISTDISQSYDY